jgi:hypothetical protein
MSEFRLPLSDEGQTVTPWSWMFNKVGSHFGLINVNMGKSSDPDLEAQILDEVGSYGRQLGQLGDAIQVLLDHVKLDELTEQEHQALRDVRLQLDQIDRLKRKRNRLERKRPQINSELLERENPDYSRALRSVTDWIQMHPTALVIDPKVLARELGDIDTGALGMALVLMVHAGLLRRVFKVLTPSGVMADGEYENIQEIPPTLPDRFERYFDTAESDVVPVFKRVA